MNKWSRIFGLLLMLAVFMGGASWGLANTDEAALTILFTHDMHDNLLPFNVIEQNGGLAQYGGYARLQSAIAQEREQDPDLLLVDGGDYSMGTLFQTIFSQEAPGLRLMGQMGYDAVTLGNHEFDFRPEGLAASLNAAKAADGPLPQLLIANLSYPVDAEGRIIGKPLQELQRAMDAYGAQSYMVLERKGYRIGIFGIMGLDAAFKAPMAGVEFTDPLEAARQVVDKLEQEEVDLIICLSHSGTVSDPDQSEDVILARKVPQIDVIISGHTHTRLDQPIVAGDTFICSAGQYGQYLGKITLTRQSGGTWSKLDYVLKPIEAGIAADAAIQRSIDAFKSTVQKSYLDEMGMKFDQVLAYTPFSFTPASQIEDRHQEEPLGNLISDAYIYAVQQAEGGDYRPVDAAIVPAGTIRASFTRGNITVADAFNVSSLGIGPDQKSGYPLLSVYLTGRELKAVCEVDASIAPLMGDAQLYISGLTYTFNPNRLIFNKVTDVALLKADGSTEAIDDDKLYRVVAGLYSGQMLSLVGDKSFGLLSIVPKSQDGTPVADLEAQIVREIAGGSNHEVKEWAALAQYLTSFAAVDGIPQVPDYYSQAQGRKMVDDNRSLGAILSRPNSIALAAYILVVLIVLAIILTPAAIIRRRRKKSSTAPPM